MEKSTRKSCEGNPCLIHHFLEKSTQLFPDKIALIHENIRASYSDINTAADKLACRLIDLGIKPGDRVAMFLDNCQEYVISYYGILKTGALAAPLSRDLKPDGLRLLLGKLEPTIIISERKFEKRLKAAGLDAVALKALILINPRIRWKNVSFQVLAWEDLKHQDTALPPDIKIEESSPASIIFTSGSTGTPKGVVLSHKNIVSNTEAICDYLQLTENDIQMAVLPFFYVMGKSLLNTHFAVGGTVVINNSFAYPASVVKQMIAEKVTGFSGVPSTYTYLLHRSPLASHVDQLDSLRYCSQAGGHMSLQIKKQLRQILPPHTKIYIMYGATEASARLTFLEPEYFEIKMQSIGKPLANVKLYVLDGNGKEAAVGQTGELAAVGPNIMQGYWQDPQATAAVLDLKGYHTGDQGYRDEDGFYYLAGRKDNMLKVGGHRINPMEIEDMLMATELILETAVVGAPDDFLGHRLVAVVAPKNADLDINQVFRLCADKLPKYKQPSEIKLVRGLPKKGSGKIDRHRCLQMLEDIEDM